VILLSQILEDELSQEYVFLFNKRQPIGAFYPYLLIVGAPSGTFTFSVEKDSEEIFSKEFTSADIKASLPTSNNHVHTFFPVIPTNPIYMEEGEFTCTISHSGYSPTSSSYLAWLQQFEDVQNDTEYTALSDDENPLAMRIKVFKEGIQ